MVKPVKNGAGRVLLMVALGLGACLHAGEKVQLKGSTSVELPKPNRNFEDSRRFKFESEGSELGGTFAPPQRNNNGPTDRKLREMLDRKRNWIFVNPYEQKFDERTTEILEPDKNATSGLMDHPLLKEEDKGVMEKFLEEKKEKRRSNNSSSSGSGSTSETREREKSEGKERPDDPQNLALAQERMEEEMKDEEKVLGRDLGTDDRNDNTVFKPLGGGLEMNDFQKRMERSPLDGGFFSQNKSTDTKMDRGELKMQQETREAEFNKLIQPRTLGGGLSGLPGRADALGSGATDAARQNGPSVATRRDSFQSGGNRLDFGGNRSGGVSASLPTANSFDAGGGFGTRNAMAPSFLPSSSPSLPSQSSSLGQAPFVHKFPQRKF
jgi:hypothetical protein